MTEPRSFRTATPFFRLFAVTILAALFTYACNNPGGPTSPTTPPPVAAGGSAGTNLAVTDGSHIDIEKATNGVDADVATGPHIPVGDPVVWTYVVSNTGASTLTGVSVTDDKLGKIACPKTTLLSGEQMTCTANGTAEAGQYRNVATVLAADPGDLDVLDRDPSHYFGVTDDDDDDDDDDRVPGIDIEKATNGVDADAPTGPVIAVGDPVFWTYVVTNTGNVQLFDIAVTDNRIGAITCPATSLAPGASMTCSAAGIAVAGQYANIGSVVGTALETIEVTDRDPSHYFGLEDTPGFVGCSHGYWKNHLAEWSQTPYAPSDLVSSVWASTLAYPAVANSTLDEALDFSGGPTVEDAIRNMLKQAVGSLLNAAHPGVSFPYTVAEVISMVDAAIATGDRRTILTLAGDLDRANNLGCPLN